MKTISNQMPKSLVQIALIFLLGVLFSVMLVSCESDEAGSSTNCEAELADLAQVMNERTTIFSQNPTPSNCTSLKNAALKLINKAKDCGYEEQYGPLTASWENIDCSEF